MLPIDWSSSFRIIRSRLDRENLQLLACFGFKFPISRSEMFGMIMFICSSSKIWIASSMRNVKNLCRIRLLHCIDYKLRKVSIFAKHGELMTWNLV